MTQHSSDALLRLVAIVVVLVILLPILMMSVFVLFMWGMGGWGGGMMGGWGGGMMTGWGMYGGLMLLVWVLVLGGIAYFVFRWLAGSRTDSADPALEELRIQYARGELSDEEFEEREARLAGDEQSE